MPNITLSIPEALHQRMKQHSEIRWSEVARLSIEGKLEALDVMDRILQKSKLTQRDVDEISREVNGAVAKKLRINSARNPITSVIG